MQLLEEVTAERLWDVYLAVTDAAPREELEKLTLKALQVVRNLEMSVAVREGFLTKVSQALRAEPGLLWALLPEYTELDISEQLLAEVMVSEATVGLYSSSVVDRYLGLLESFDSGPAWQEAGYRTHRTKVGSLGWGSALTDPQIHRLWKGLSRHRAVIDWDKITPQPVNAQLSAQLITSSEIAPELKLLSLASVRDGWGVHLTSPVLQALAEAAQETKESGFFLQAWRALPDSKGQDFLLALLQAPEAQVAGSPSQPTIPDSLVLSLRVDDMREEVVDAVLNRFPYETFRQEEFADKHELQALLESAVHAMVGSGLPKYEAPIQAASENSKLQGALVNAIGRHRREDLFGLLTDVVRDSVAGDGLWHSGISSVASFLNDEAMEFLLEHAREVSTAGNREKVMNYLEDVRQWQEASEQWERSRSSRNQRLDSIAELVALAEDASLELSVRAEALRGLGLLQATEELPRLVRALSAPEEELREAAREAIDRLHALADSEE